MFTVGRVLTLPYDMEPDDTDELMDILLNRQILFAIWGCLSYNNSVTDYGGAIVIFKGDWV